MPRSTFSRALLACAQLFLTAHASECPAVSSGVSCGLTASDEASCVANGCCWSGDAELSPCTTPAIPGYELVNSHSETGLITGNLSLISSSGIFNGTSEFEFLTVEVKQQTNGRTRVLVSPVGAQRWTVPESLLPRPEGFYTGGAMFPGGFYTEAHLLSSDPFRFEIERINGGVNPKFNDVIFNFTQNMVYQDQYLQFTLTSHEDTLATYGWGESTRAVQQLQEGTVYTLWASDIGAFTFDTSLYGTHPFVIQVLSTGKAHGFMFLNSNAMELTVTRDADGRQALTVQSTGGAMEIYVFGGPTPEEVIRQYLDVIGRPALVPHWSLGFHNCRWGYPDVQYVEEVVANYSAAAIPLQTQWMDIDYMDKYLDFTVDPVSFSQADMTAFIASLHAEGQTFVPIVDPGIYVRDAEYSTFSRGLEQNVFVMDMENVNPYLGQVWPGPTYFPDWFAPNTSSWWATEFAQFRDLVQYDGVWIDMNEVANFCNVDGGDQLCSLDPSEPSCAWGDNSSCCLVCSTIDPTNPYDFPPFVPHVFYGTLGGKTMSMNSYHFDNVLEYNAHSLYGFMESMATNAAVSAITGERPFVLSRSTYMGSGKYTAHWTGDNAATWADLAASIVTMNNMALFGIPMIGADICGFAEDTTEELCNRWIQVGAFSPFSRNHNIDNAIPQELYRWDSVAASSRLVLSLRYRLLPLLYTYMANAHFLGNTVHNAMWMHFPHDPHAHTSDYQYMWAGALLFTPVVEEGATSVQGYFPYGVWYSLLDDTYIDCTEGGYLDGGKYVTLDTPADTTNVHVRAGHIVPMQDYHNTTEAVRASPFTLLVALGPYQVAEGTLFIDDGRQLEVQEASYIYYEADHSVLRSVPRNSSYSLETNWLRSVEVWGIDAEDDDCVAVLILDNETLVMPEATELVQVGGKHGYSKLVITFGINETVNIVSYYELTWSCGEDSSSSSSSSSGGGGGDDENGAFGDLDETEEGLAITAIVVGGLAVVLGGAFVVSKFVLGAASSDAALLSKDANSAL